MDRIEHFLHTCFDIPFYSTTSNIIDSGPDGGSESIFDRILTADIKKEGLFEIPTLMEEEAKELTHYDTMYMPIGLTTAVIPKRTVAPILSVFDICNGRLITINTSKGERYYGSRGLILNSDFKIIFITTAEGYLKDNGDFYPVRYIGRVPPRTFANVNGLLEKAICRKFIPYLSSMNITIHPYSNSISQRDIGVTTIIEDCDKFLITPSVPKASSDINEVLNDVVVNNIESLI